MRSDRHTAVGGGAVADDGGTSDGVFLGATGGGGSDVPLRMSGDGPRAGRAATGRVPDDVLLDAARECVLAHGVRRTTLTDIARTAGVSRMTLYRRFPDVRRVLAALMTREFGALLHEVSTHDGGAVGDTDIRHARRRLVDIAVASVRALAADPLLRTVLDRDAEMLLPYIVQRLGATQQLAERVVRTMVDEGHDDGSVRHAAPTPQTRSVVLVVQSFVLSHRPATADLASDELLDELRHLLDAALTPTTEHHGKEPDE